MPALHSPSRVSRSRRLASFSIAVAIQFALVAVMNVQVSSRYRPPAYDPVPLIATLLGDDVSLAAADMTLDDAVTWIEAPAVSMTEPEIEAIGADPIAHVGPRYTDAPAPPDPWMDSDECRDVRQQLNALFGLPPHPALRARADACIWTPTTNATAASG